MAFAQAPTLLDLIPGGRQAVSFLLGKIADFQRVPARLAAAQTTLLSVKRAADQRGQLGPSTQAAALLGLVQQTQANFVKTAAQVGTVLDALRQTGLMQTPVDLALSAVSVAGDVAAILGATEDIERQTQALASGQGITPTPGVTGKIVSWGKYLLIGGAIYAGLWAVSRGGGRMRKY
jgi:hypothetical protein